MTTIKCVGFSKGLVPAGRYQRFRLEQPSFGISGLEPDGALFKCVSGSEGLVGVGRYQRFRLGAGPSDGAPFKCVVFRGFGSSRSPPAISTRF